MSNSLNTEPLDELNANTSSEVLREQRLAIGISGLICCLLLIPILTVEAVYVCRYRTTFLQRLWFYLTIALIIVDGAYAINLGSSFIPSSSPSHLLLNLILDSLQLCTLSFEVLLIGSINLTILSKMYKYAVRRKSLQPNTVYMICCCFHTKHREVFFLIVTIILSLVLTSIFTAVEVLLGEQSEETIPVEIHRAIGFVVNSIIIVIDLMLSGISLAVLAIWFCILKKKKVLKNKIEEEYKKMLLIVGFLVMFALVYWILSIVPKDQQHHDLLIAFAALNPIVQSTLSLAFFVYVCVKICNSREIHRITEHPGIVDTNDQSTAPTSSRVSLPTDTAEHAPNFLSPSTAEPSELSGLIN